MSIIPTTRGNPQASDTAVEVQLPMTGNAVRQDLQSTLGQNDAEVSKLYEDRNLELSQGGLISFSGSQLTFTEILTLEVNSKVAGGSPVVIPLGVVGSNIYSGPFNVPASGDMVYAVIDRIAGTAVVTDSATTLPAVNYSNQEVWLIGKRNDAADGTMRFYFRDGTGISAGQTIRLGAPTSTVGTPSGVVEMFAGTVIPAGYLLCDGTAYEVTDYVNLAAALLDSGTGNYAYGSPNPTYASYTGTIPGTSTPITLDAITSGSVGNSIDLTFNSSINAESLTSNNTYNSNNSATWPAQGFTTTETGTVLEVDLQLSYMGTLPSGNLTVQIYTSSGGTPGGSLLATSNPVDSATLTGTAASYAFTFNTLSTIDLTDSTQYCLALNTSGVTYGGGTMIKLSIDTTNPYSGGEISYTTNSGRIWAANAGQDAYFIVITSPSINDEIVTWNAANPSNQVSLTSGDGTQVPSNGASAQLSGGSDADTMFNVPDLRGMFVRGVDSGAGNDPDASSRTSANPNGNTGDNIGSSQTDAFENHAHYANQFNQSQSILTGPGGNGFTSGTVAGVNVSTTGFADSGTYSTETRPKNIYMNYIIKI